MKEQNFYVCKRCGNMVESLKESGAKIICCGEPMVKLEPGTVEASVEKHVPAVTYENDIVKVEVGSVLHPMIDTHYIEWILVRTENGEQRKVLKPGDEPKAEFCLCGDKPVAVYAYCNLHGLWKAEI
ncbi:Desulfoferrodoxin ferrous iron-binding region [Clostridium sp. DL-VIII]|uniref:desulfoferrodoxin family protein n=1 Tax=Clostridium sp. DL-VIII TaxID=641107 RepID=UPI00023AF6F5|nr:desulfoferrodoxin family protein [Clostridium sp. DL-VIII]EHI96822.1 Desulfoferrodoxin ferrous iron-binding region [Clostridium sp. DL-VIII]